MPDHVPGFRLSPQQKRLYLSRQEQPPYVAQCAILLNGNVNTQWLREALQRVVERHEIFRTTFHRPPGMKSAVQIVNDHRQLFWDDSDLTGWGRRQQEEKIEAL